MIICTHYHIIIWVVNIWNTDGICVIMVQVIRDIYRSQTSPVARRRWATLPPPSTPAYGPTMVGITSTMSLRKLKIHPGKWRLLCYIFCPWKKRLGDRWSWLVPKYKYLKAKGHAKFFSHIDFIPGWKWCTNINTRGPEKSI